MIGRNRVIGSGIDGRGEGIARRVLVSELTRLVWSWGRGEGCSELGLTWSGKLRGGRGVMTDDDQIPRPGYGDYDRVREYRIGENDKAGECL